MTTHWMRRGLAAAVLVPLLSGVTACSDGDKDGASKADAGACKDLPTAAPAAKLPPGLPSLGDQVLYEPSTQGKTSIVFGLVDESDFVGVRDELVDKLKAAGWKIDGTDQESVEAEAQFSKGREAGTIKVEPLCKGYVTVRYKLSQ